ncbi:MAG: class I SAM-dependent methyltransferase [Candidatus Riflebacteria bacterium]|nr:class I SAM-dependent methyltransferase [Candidatus Riflebacteria bacterium]
MSSPDGPDRPGGESDRGRHNRLQPYLLEAIGLVYRPLLDRRRRRLLGTLQGEVLEIGPGTGPNLPYYTKDVRWTGVEPNVRMHGWLEGKASRLGLRFRVVESAAERLPAADSSVDAVVSTLVLCTVRDPPGAVSEAMRVLRPGGRFICIEHVAAPERSWLGWTQRRIRPLWRALADGCEPDRRTWEVLESAGFSGLEIERFWLPLPLVCPHLAAICTR